MNLEEAGLGFFFWVGLSFSFDLVSESKKTVIAKLPNKNLKKNTISKM